MLLTEYLYVDKRAKSVVKTYLNNIIIEMSLRGDEVLPKFLSLIDHYSLGLQSFNRINYFFYIHANIALV